MLEKLWRFVVTSGLVMLSSTTALASPLGEPRMSFVSATEAVALIARGATVLDARSRGYLWGHLPHAQPLDWLDFRDGWGRTGRLDRDVTRIAQRLAARGVDEKRPVLVYGAAQHGFGEEGRIAWMLAYLGHLDVAILDGGIAAWQQAGQKLSRGLSEKVTPGAHFVATENRAIRADRQAVRAAERGPAILLDVRSREEFYGATPYLEARGGHIPGARHLDWRAALDDSGKLRSDAELQAIFTPLGIDENSEVIVYCTGGVRSAFAWAILRRLGVRHVRNYDGSFWEWAADKSLPVALPKDLSEAKPSSPAPR